MYAMSMRSPSGTSVPSTASTTLATGVLAGESGLLDLEGRRDEDTTIGWHLVAGFEADDVTWHELLGRHLDELAVAPHPAVMISICRSAATLSAALPS